MSSYRAVIPTGGSAPKKCFLLPSTALSTFLKRSEFFSKPWKNKLPTSRKVKIPLQWWAREVISVAFWPHGHFNKWICLKTLFFEKSILENHPENHHVRRYLTIFDDIWLYSMIFDDISSIFDDILRYSTIFDDIRRYSILKIYHKSWFSQLKIEVDSRKVNFQKK